MSNKEFRLNANTHIVHTSEQAAFLREIYDKEEVLCLKNNKAKRFSALRIYDPNDLPDDSVASGKRMTGFNNQASFAFPFSSTMKKNLASGSDSVILDQRKKKSIHSIMSKVPSQTTARTHGLQRSKYSTRTEKSHQSRITEKGSGLKGGEEDTQSVISSVGSVRSMRSSKSMASLHSLKSNSSKFSTISSRRSHKAPPSLGMYFDPK
eukprot:TRINITY_DN29873_c0_g1_i1.p1 TRINITY_DN29873_c0_g1~~TRINITY_DN29873_c0_g1_i1.p1  ORF type:complete len:208 (+),score=48.56 TRINITY_DN29873_c0_g1_i1:139-762(+)